MKVILCVFLIIWTFAQTFHANDESQHFSNDFTIEIDDTEEQANSIAESLAKRHGFRVLDKLFFPSIGHVYTLRHEEVSVRSKRHAVDFINLLGSHPQVKNAAQEKILIREKREIIHDKQSELELEYYEDKSVFQRYEGLGMKKDGIPVDTRAEHKDPYYKDQWYLKNTGQAGGPPGLDINVVPAWKKGFTGKGVVVCTLDDGIDHKHPDLKRNYDPKASTDLNDRDDKEHDPEPDMEHPYENSHGTRCAGEIAAEADNDVCGVGVAYDAKIGGIRILDGRVTGSLEAKALLFNNNYIDILSASWGPRDNGFTMESPPKYCMEALKQGAEQGRNGKGTIFMWATGNGGRQGDCCNADGYVGSIYTLAIGSVNNYAQSTYFTESCPSQLAVIYSGGYHDYDAVKQGRETHPILKVVTTDVGGKCTLNFQGTSSAAPLAAGCMALTVQANPNITWRDAQHIIVNTARIPNKDESGWIINGANKHVNPKFGFGVMDCGKMVEVAQTWKNVPPQHVCTGKTVKVDKALTSMGKVISEYTTDGCQRDSDNRIDHLEHIQMRFKMTSSRRGAVKITLTSPAGTPSEMLSPRPKDTHEGEFEFTFMSVHKWGENPRGKWKLEVEDTVKNENSETRGHVIEWQLILYGFSDEVRQGKKVEIKSHEKGTAEAQVAGKHTLAKIMEKEQQKTDQTLIKSADKPADGDNKDDGKGKDGDNGSDRTDGGGDDIAAASKLLNSLLKLSGFEAKDGDAEMIQLFTLLKHMIKNGKLKGLSHLSDDDIKDVLKKYLEKDRAVEAPSEYDEGDYYELDRKNVGKDSQARKRIDEKSLDTKNVESYVQGKNIADKKVLDRKNEDMEKKEYSENEDDQEIDYLEKIDMLLEDF